MENNELKTVEVEKQITPMNLLQVATESGADIDKLEKLMEMQMKWEENEAKKAYVSAMAGFRAECPSINKDMTVDYTSQKGRTTYKHASLAGTIEQIKDILGKYGLSHSWKTNQEGSLITVACTITHSQGHSESTSLSGTADSSGGKNTIQSIGSTVSYLQRYSLTSILGLASSESDDDGAGSEFITDEQVETLRELIQETKSDVGAFLKYVKAENLGEILMVNYGKAESALKAKVKK